LKIIETSRLYLRQLDNDDAPFVLKLLNEAGFLQFIGDKGVRTLADARAYLCKGPLASYRQYGFGLYLVCLRDMGAGIGICGLVKRDSLQDVDLGFAFLSRYCGLGYAAEAAGAVLEHGRAVLGLRRIVAITALDNQRSMSLLEKLGLRFEHTIKLDEAGPDLNLYGSPSSDK